MAEGGRSLSSSAVAETDVDECTKLQMRLEAKRIECSQHEAALAQAQADKAEVQKAGLSGITAAKTQMTRLRSELVAVRQWRDAHTGDSQLVPDPVASDADEERKAQVKAKQLEARSLRHELSRWRHQVEILEAKLPRQEDEIVRLKDELTHTLEVLTSTQYAVKHRKVDREFQQGTALPQSPSSSGDANGQVPLRGGGHGTIEAHAERLIREGVEAKNERLSGKAKKLSGVVAAQQLLIQRLEKQVLKEEKLLDHKDERLHEQAGRAAQLKLKVRKNSDSHVAKMLGVAAQQPNRQKGYSTNSSMSLEAGGSGLPPI